jgi:hypothetical protein
MLSLSLFLRASLCRTLSVPRQQKSVFISLSRRSLAKAGVHPWLKTHFCKALLRFPRAIQGYSRLSKPIQGLLEKRIVYFLFTGPIHSDLLQSPLPPRLGARVVPTAARKAFEGSQSVSSYPKVFQTVPSHFQEKKDCLFFLSRPFALQPPPLHDTNQTNPKSKSTVGYRKLTVDLGCELLIWGKNGLPTSALPACRSPFHPLMTRKSYRANQKQTEANQKINASTLDLGCEENACPVEKTATAQI